MSTGQEITQRTPEQQLVAQVRSEQFKEQVAMVLPPTVTLDRFVRIATTAIMTNPAIAQIADQQSVLRAFVQAAADGLMPDGKEGAIVGRGGKAVWQPMIHGVRKSAADYGWTITAKAVYGADVFEWSDEPPTRLHQPPRPGIDRGDIIGAYAVAKHSDGRELQMFMPWADIAKRRDLATTKQVWDKWPAEMAEKTVGKALFADLPLAEADRERLARVFDSAQIEPSEAARLIYGPPSETPVHSLPAGVGNQPGRADGEPSPPEGQSAAGTDASREPQQHNGVAADPAAVAPPGGDEPEPSLDDEPAQQQFTTPTGVDDDPIVAAARAASQFQIPNGQHKGLALAELQAKGEKGTSWLRWALKQGEKLQPDDYRGAVWAFARVYAPDLYQEVLAWHEAQVAS